MLSPRAIVEVACASVADCLVAEEAGADRFELCSALVLGGLTPSVGVLATARARTARPIVCMIRPRAGSFCYSDDEFDAMRRDVEACAAAGADGVAFGVLTPDGDVDAGRCRELAALARPLDTVFHRAFDVVRDPESALDVLVALGITRVLTSGRARTALEGAPLIRALAGRAAGRIEILPGGGVRAGNIVQVLEATGIGAVHLGPQATAEDASGAANPLLEFAEPGAAPRRYAVLDGQAVRDACRAAAAWPR
jgi:copper homeostasis protein